MQMAWTGRRTNDAGSADGVVNAPLGTFTRVLVKTSALLAVAAGLWLVAARPGVCASLLVVFVGTAIAARWRLVPTAAIVLLLAYVAYGLTHVIGGPALAPMPYWLAAFAGLSLGGSSWTRWEAGGGWRVPLAWWATGVAIAWPVFTVRGMRDLALPPDAGLIITTALLQIAVALWMDRLLAPQPRASVDHAAGRWSGALAASAAVTAAAGLYQRFIDVTWLSAPPWTELHRAVGLMGDANPMGVATAVWAPLILARKPRGTWEAVGGGLLAMTLWGAAWASGARTMLILLAAGAAGLAIAWSRTLGYSLRRVAATMVAAIALAAAAGAVLNMEGAAGTPVGRLWATSRWSSPGDALYEILWRRDGYGLAAVEAIKEHPVTGVGVGRFFGLSPTYHQRRTGRAIPPDNAQNLWRQTLVEQGALGLLPILWLSALTIRSLLAPAATHEDLVVRALVAGLGLALMVGYPVQDAGIAVTVGTLVAWVGRSSLDGSPAPGNRSPEA